VAKKKNSQKRILAEIQNQLMIKAKKLGVDHLYTPLRLEEMKLEAAKRIMGDLLAEKTNLEYERSLTGEQNKDSIIKLEKITAYINKALRVIDKHEKNIERMLAKTVGDPHKTKNALKRHDLVPSVSTTR
jgi:hypothetical protein